MTTQFRNLVFEGGGVKALAYLGALEHLEDEGILQAIQRVGGTSAGAVTALLCALHYPIAGQKLLMSTLDFSHIMDDSFGYIRDIHRLTHDFGWYRGDRLMTWISDIIADVLGSRTATFHDLAATGTPHLYIVGTNLSTQRTVVFSHDTTPDTPVALAVRISISVPLVFTAVRYGPRNDVMVDGGVLNNYPVKLFDKKHYISPDLRTGAARDTAYYAALNTHRKEYVYNRQTLGFRVDSTREIEYFHHNDTPTETSINNFPAFTRALITALSHVQEKQHLHSDDWARTVYIDTGTLTALEFDIDDSTRSALIRAGKQATRNYLEWFESSDTTPVNRIT